MDLARTLAAATPVAFVPGLALALGLLCLGWRARAQRLDVGYAIDAALAGIIVGLVAGRAGAVLLHLDRFSGALTALLDPRQGGLEYRTLVACGILTYLLVVASRDRWRAYASAVTPAVALAAAVVWAGAALSGRGAGLLWGPPFALQMPDAYGIVAPRLPLPLLMACLHLLVGLLAVVAPGRLLPQGASLAFWGAITAGTSALLAGYAAGPTVRLAGAPLGLLADAALATLWLAFAAALIFARPNAATRAVPRPAVEPAEDESACPPAPAQA